jgi:hypothetical protein
MHAAPLDEKNKTAAVLYAQIQRELDVLVSEIEDQEYRLPELERIARIYALVAEAPIIRTGLPQ